MSEKWTLRGSGVGVVAALGGIEVVLRSLSTPAGAVADVVASTLSVVLPVVVVAHLWVGGTIGAPSPVVTAVGGVAVLTGVGAWKAYEVAAVED